MNDTDNFLIDIVEGIITNSSPLDAGVYPLQVSVNDTWGRSISAIILITVQDTTRPSWVEIPSDQGEEYGLIFRYDLNATDASTIQSWWLNDTLRFGISEAGVITSKAVLPVGMYGLHIHVNDTWGLELDVEITVTIEDTTSPDWYRCPKPRHSWTSRSKTDVRFLIHRSCILQFSEDL